MQQYFQSHQVPPFTASLTLLLEGRSHAQASSNGESTAHGLEPSRSPRAEFQGVNWQADKAGSCCSHSLRLTYQLGWALESS